MEVDDDNEGTQRVKRVPDFGIEVDFEVLTEDDRKVCSCGAVYLALLATNSSYIGYIGRDVERSRRRDCEGHG